MSFTASQRQRSGPVLPLAGMVDVLFLLLIFFMITSIFREFDKQIEVSLPATETGTTVESPMKVVITITKNDEIFIGDRQYDLDNLRQMLAKLAAAFPDESVVIRGDRGSRLGTAVNVMDIAYAANLNNVAIGSREP